MSKNVYIGILRKIKFFTHSVLSVGVPKLAITTINCVECLHEAGKKSTICISQNFGDMMTSPLLLKCHKWRMLVLLHLFK